MTNNISFIKIFISLMQKKKFVCDKMYFFTDKTNFIPDKKVVKMYSMYVLFM